MEDPERVPRMLPLQSFASRTVDNLPLDHSGRRAAWRERHWKRCLHPRKEC